MTLSRTLTQWIGRLLIGVVLFAQLAVASYACPGMQAMGQTQSVAADMHADCDQRVPDASNLCAAHCHQGQQSADTASVHVPVVGVPNFLYSIPLEPAHVLGSGRSFPAPEAHLDAAPEPPHAILHCVFRL